MLLAGKESGIIFMADPDYDNGRPLFELEYDLNVDFIHEVMGEARAFYEREIFTSMITKWGED